ncbi:MAG: hypothetical protein GY861_25975, partial [bacterium]|nr:hypothetical protein [bacterium]
NGLQSALIATLSTPIYSPKQLNALGTAQFSFTLPRNIIPNGKIVFEGNFSTFTTANTPKANVDCYPSIGGKIFGNNWTKGDLWIESCDISKIDTITDSIVILTKSLVYKCTLSKDKSVYVKLSPVTIGDVATSNTYRVLLKGFGTSASTQLIKSSSADLTMPAVTIAAKPAVDFTADTVCPLNYTDVFPRIPGALIDWTWNFDITTKKTELNNTKMSINDITLFPPQKYFGGFANSMTNTPVCVYKTKRTRCSFSSEGVLNVSLNPAAVPGTDFTVTLKNVPFGAMDEAWTFLCTVNNLTGTTRTNLMTGSGKMKAATVAADGMVGVILKAELAKTYSLTAFPNNTAGDAIFFSSDSSPRGTSTLALRFGLDLVGTWSAQAKVTFTKTPSFFVFLPKEFTGLTWALQPSSSYKPTITITPYTVDTAGTVAKGTVIKTGETKNSGNIIWTTASADVVFDTTARYFDVTIAGVRNPGNNITTRAINFAILTAAADMLAKTWTSSNNQVNNLAALTYTTIPKPTDTNSPTSSLIYTTYPGLKFGATAKWDANYNSNNKQNGNAGRYISGYWTVYTNTALAISSPGLCDISLDAGSVFSPPVGVTKWVLNTTLTKVKVKFGATCKGSTAGRYFTFWTAKCINFYALQLLL